MTPVLYPWRASSLGKTALRLASRTMTVSPSILAQIAHFQWRARIKNANFRVLVPDTVPIRATQNTPGNGPFVPFHVNLIAATAPIPPWAGLWPCQHPYCLQLIARYTGVPALLPMRECSSRKAAVCPGPCRNNRKGYTI